MTLPDHLGTTKQEAATAMRRLEETAVAAMIGWAKAAAEVEKLAAERDRAKGIAEGLHKELRDAVAARGQAERERDEALKERREESAALDRVREYVGGELVFTNAEMSALADCCDDHYEECAAVWRGYFLRVVLAALDGSGT